MAHPTETPDLGIADRIRRSNGRGGRVISATAKLSRDELDEVTAAAARDTKALGEWCRDVLLREARRGCTDTAIFTELMAFRLLVSGVLRDMALSDKAPGEAVMTEERYEAHLAGARKNKHTAASQALAQYRFISEGEK